MSYISQSDLQSRRLAARRRARRRRAAAAGVLAAAIVAAGLFAFGGDSHPRARVSARAGAAPSFAGSSSRTAGAKRLPPIAAAKPGTAHVILRGPATHEVALTFDDGFCAPCVARIVRTLGSTGAHATIFPNGVYGKSWTPQAAAIRRLAAAGQLQLGNHTFLHHDAQLESAAAFQSDLVRDEDWIEHTFGVTARPFFRPPYGAYNASTLAIAGQNGYTKVITWSGTVADSSPRTIGYILAAIRHWAHPGAIILMHGNYPATSIALPQILQILHSRGLRPVTLKEMLG
jgi:peptidoglycan/xylan/chitin deacetylase (PgdA/CDA1 family)